MSSGKALAPIALFAYNRPVHTRRVLEALQANPEARLSRLTIFCDGPKPDCTLEERARIEEVRAIARERAWAGEVSIEESPQNRGLADSIRSGVERLLAEHDRVIVLEDDIVVSTGFLKWINEALDAYENEHHVMHISSYLPQSSYPWLLPGNFLLRFMSCWGWATWRRAWRFARWDAGGLLGDLDRYPGGRQRFDLDGAAAFSGQLVANRDGLLRTWAIFWGASIYLNGGYCLFPGRTLSANIGTDGSGENFKTDQSSAYAVSLADSVDLLKPRRRESRRARAYFKGFYRYGNDARILKRLRQTLGLTKHRIVKWGRRNRWGGKQLRNGLRQAISWFPPVRRLIREREILSDSLNRTRGAIGAHLVAGWESELSRFSPGKDRALSPGVGVVHVLYSASRGGAGLLAKSIHDGLAGRFPSQLLTAADLAAGAHGGSNSPLDQINEEMIRYGVDSSLRGFTSTTSRDILRHPGIMAASVVHLHNLHPDYFNLFALPQLSSAKRVVWTLHDEAAFTGHCGFTMECDGWLRGCRPCPHLSRYVELNEDKAGYHYDTKRVIYSKSKFELICPSQWLADRASNSILGGHPVRVIPNGVDTGIFRPGDKLVAREQLKLPKDAFICGYCADNGTDNPFKGGDILREIVARTGSSKVLYVAVGGGWSDQSRNVRSLGYIADPARLALAYQAMDVFLYPSRADSFGLVVAEAMACGLTVISSAVGGIPEVVGGPETGFLVRSNDAGEFISVLREVRDRKIDVGPAAEQRVRSLFSKSLMLERYAGLYSEMGVSVSPDSSAL